MIVIISNVTVAVAVAVAVGLCSVLTQPKNGLNVVHLLIGNIKASKMLLKRFPFFSHLHDRPPLLTSIAHLHYTPLFNHSGRFRTISHPGLTLSALCKHSATHRRGPCCTSLSPTTTSELQTIFVTSDLHCYSLTRTV